MKSKTLIMLVSFLIGSTTGCTMLQGTERVEPFVAQYFDSIRNRDFDKVMTFYGDEMFRPSPSRLTVTKSQWQQTLPKLHDRLGELQSYSLEQWSIKENVGVGSAATESGTYYDLIYQVTYAKGQATERIVVFSPKGGTDEDAKVIGHHISSPALLE